MVWLWVLGGAGLLLAAALAVPVKVDVLWEEDPAVTLRYLFLKFKLLPPPQKPKAKKKKDKKQEEAPKKKAEKPKESTLQRLMEYAELLPPLLGSAARQAGFVLKRIILTDTRLEVVVAEENACLTGIRYGQVNAAVYTAYGAVRQVLRVRQRRVQIEIRPDFLSQQGSVSFCCRLKVPVWAGIWAALRLGTDFIIQAFRCSPVGDAKAAKK